MTILPIKKPKLSHTSSVVSGGVVRSTSITPHDSTDAWEACALDFDPADYMNLLSEAISSNDQEKVVSTLIQTYFNCYTLQNLNYVFI